MTALRVTQEWLDAYKARAAKWTGSGHVAALSHVRDQARLNERESARLANVEIVDKLRRAPHSPAPSSPAPAIPARGASPDAAVTKAALDAGYAPLVGMCRDHGLPLPVPEWRFHPVRKWRFDYGFPLHMLALEIEGGQWINGRHNRASGQIADLEKYSEAAILGWRVLYATPDELRNGVALDRVRRALGYRAPEAA